MATADSKRRILEMFPGINEGYVDDLLLAEPPAQYGDNPANPVEWLVQRLVEMIVGNGDYPRQARQDVSSLASSKRPRSQLSDTFRGKQRKLSPTLSPPGKRQDDPITFNSSDGEQRQGSSHLNPLELDVECQVCFSEELVSDQVLCCSGSPPHVTCHECMRRYADHIIGQAEGRMLCPADTQCGAGFAPSKLCEVLDQKRFDQIEQLQLNEDLMLAAIEGLEECPFCVYKEIYPPIDEDKEFRCLNPTCEQASCRMCRKPSHLPMTCDEAARNQKDSVRHALEEAMTDALVRKCNGCKTLFLKMDGCNFMTCSRCRNTQCYVCHKDVPNHDHFRRTACPLFDNTAERHEQEVNQAMEEAKAKLRAANPEMTEQELEIGVSEKVKADINADIQRGRPTMARRQPQVALGAAVHPFPPIRPAPPGNPFVPQVMAWHQELRQAHGAYVNAVMNQRNQGPAAGPEVHRAVEQTQRRVEEVMAARQAVLQARREQMIARAGPNQAQQVAQHLAAQQARLQGLYARQALPVPAAARNQAVATRPVPPLQGPEGVEQGRPAQPLQIQRIDDQRDRLKQLAAGQVDFQTRIRKAGERLRRQAHEVNLNQRRMQQQRRQQERAMLRPYVNPNVLQQTIAGAADVPAPLAPILHPPPPAPLAPVPRLPPPDALQVPDHS